MFEQMSKLSSILKEHAKCDMIEGSMRLWKGKLLLIGLDKEGIMST